MGTTVVGAMFSARKRRMYIGHVGDSRCYRVRTGQIQLLTRDHSLINDYLLAMPDLTEEQKSELPKNVITRALGMQDQVVVDLQHDDPQPSDVYVLCSDGLSGMVTDEEIQKIITGTSDVREACRRLIQRANERGGEDNITAVLIQIEEADAESQLGRTVVEVEKPLATTGPAASGVSFDDETMPAIDTQKVALRVAEATKDANSTAPETPPDAGDAKKA
jgi:serine/threonine protein phosphatase PrpC